MKNFVTIVSVEDSLRANLIQGKLAEKGFESNLKNELSNQTFSFIGNQMGGIDIQVHESQATESYNFLLDIGLISNSVGSKENRSEWFTRITSHIPLIKNLRKEVQLILLLFIPLAIAFLFLLFFTS